MTNRKGGFRRKSRHKLAKKQSGKISIANYLQEFSEGDRVTLNMEPAIHKGIFNLRFQGKGGVVEGRRGDCYHVRIKDVNKSKSLIVHPIHLRSADTQGGKVK